MASENRLFELVGHPGFHDRQRVIFLFGTGGPDGLGHHGQRRDRFVGSRGRGDELRRTVQNERRDHLDDLKQRTGRAPLLAYGGMAFNLSPHIPERLGGVYLGEDAGVAVQTLDKHLNIFRKRS